MRHRGNRTASSHGAGRGSSPSPDSSLRSGLPAPALSGGDAATIMDERKSRALRDPADEPIVKTEIIEEPEGRYIVTTQTWQGEEWKIIATPAGHAALNAPAWTPPRKKRGQPPRAPLLRSFFEEHYPDTITVKKAILRAEILKWRPDLKPLADKTLAKAIDEHNARRLRK
jgi:hypothetical protein